MIRLCKALLFFTIAAVPFRNVFTAVLSDTLGMLVKEIVLVGCCLCAVLVLLAHEELRARLRGWLRTLDVQIVLMFAAYVLVLCVFCLPGSPTQSFLGMAVYLSYVMLFGLVLLLLSGKEIEGILRFVIFYVFPIVSVGAILSIVSKSPIVASQEVAYLGTPGEQVADAFRATSFTGSSLHLGLYNAMLLPLAFAFLLNREDTNWKSRVWLLGVFGLGLMSLTISFSRGAWVQSAIGILVVAIIYRRKMAKYAVLWAVIGAVCAVFLVSHRESLALYSQRLTSIMDWSSGEGNVSRIYVWNRSLRLFAESGFLGYGPAATGNAATKLATGDITAVTESSYLKILLELGFVGFIIFVTMLGRFVAMCLRLVGRTKLEKVNWLAVGIFGSLVGLVIEMAIYQSIETQVVQAILWFFLAGVLVLYREAMRPDPEPEQEVVQT